MLKGKSGRHQQIWSTVEKVPRGKVATYGQVARLSKLSQQARLVGYALHALPHGIQIPWHRVINSKGMISFPANSDAFKRQKNLLEKEGVIFVKGRIDLNVFGWKKYNKTPLPIYKSMNKKREKIRCAWSGTDPLYIKYHDEEWGVPQHDDRKLFEMLILEGAQAGLSWITILRKRENYRKAFDNFNARKIAAYNKRKTDALLKNEGIVRNRLKINAAVLNAQAYLNVQKEFGSFDTYIWQFVGGKPIRNRRKSLKEIPATTPESDAMSRDLKKRGFKFVGSTICYAFMQATGMANDHTKDCWKYR
ncbi:MAG: DNA-3-methyladenine glycosylase I [Bacteroidetes bacterium]|nr:DNA-3-methyladenine glycosylase I [Bacteroidota bacterium]MCW5894514.1 DNA-3-methyladenine glycosylase I [Bacteroidota bacterium]